MYTMGAFITPKNRHIRLSRDIETIISIVVFVTILIPSFVIMWNSDSLTQTTTLLMLPVVFIASHLITVGISVKISQYRNKG